MTIQHSQSSEILPRDILDSSGLFLFFRSKRIEKPLLDETGRPLGEGKCPEAVRERFKIEYRECPFTDSPESIAGRMNITGLARTQKNGPRIYAILLGLREMYCGYRSLSGSLRYFDAWRFVEMVKQLVIFLWYTEKEKFLLTEELADLYKVNLGANVLFRNLAYAGRSNKLIDADSIVDPEVLFDFADHNSMFNGKSESCPASKQHIINFLRLIVDGKMSGIKPLPISELPIQSPTLLYRFSNVSCFLSLIKYLQVQNYLLAEFENMRGVEGFQQIAGKIGLNLKKADWRERIASFQKNVINPKSPICQLDGIEAREVYSILAPLKLGSHLQSEFERVDYIIQVLFWLEREYLSFLRPEDVGESKAMEDENRGENLYREMFSEMVSLQGL